MSQHICAVFFDLFDTLYLHPEPRDRVQEYIGRAQRVGVGVSREAMVQALTELENHIASKVVREPNFAALKARNAMEYYAYWSAQLLRLLGASGDLEARGLRMCEEYVRDDGLFLDPQAVEVLTELRRCGLATGLITNSPKLLLEVLPTLAITDLLDNVTISSVVGFEKPDSRIFWLAANYIGLAPAQCVLVGDTPAADIVGAKDSGMTGVLINRDNRHKQPGVDCYQIEQLYQVLDVIDLLNSK